MTTLNRASTTRKRLAPKVVLAPTVVAKPAKTDFAKLLTIQQIYRPSVTLGCDPELFVTDAEGRVVGSDRFIPAAVQSSALVARDGVQVEFHPPSGGCRQGLASNIAQAFKSLRQHLDVYERDHKGEKLKINFKQLVTVRKEELMALSESARALGCQPSLSVYGKPHVELDGLEYRKRSAAGHIHLGSDVLTKKQLGSLQRVNVENVVKLLDILVANTLVMIDRDEGNVERRKNYGLAGEYRQKPYGIEYRTLSNFWLRAYPLMSLTFALARNAFGVAYSDVYAYDGSYHKGLGKLILEHADLDKVQQAINTNDYNLAKETYDEIARPVFASLIAYDGVHSGNVKALDKLITKSAEEWFPGDPTKHWMNYSGNADIYTKGWENYATDLMAQP